MSSENGRSERVREVSRAPLEAPVSLQLDAFSSPQEGFSANVSVGGLFVKTPEPQSVGTIVRFELELPSPAGVIRGTAEVVWIRTHSIGLDQAPGMGLEFRYIDEPAKQRLMAAVAQALEANGLPEIPVLPPAVARARRRGEPSAGTGVPSPGPTHAKPSPPTSTRERIPSPTEPRRPAVASAKSGEDRQTSKLPANRKLLIVLVILLVILLFVLSRAL